MRDHPSDADPFAEEERRPERSEWAGYRAIARRKIPSVRAAWERRLAELGHDPKKERP